MVGVRAAARGGGVTVESAALGEELGSGDEVISSICVGYFTSSGVIVELQALKNMIDVLIAK